MRSSNLLSKLNQIPLSKPHPTYTPREILEQATAMRNDLFAIEVAAGTEQVLNSLFEAHNVSDDLFNAYSHAFPNVAATQSLYEHYEAMVDSGPKSVLGFLSALKGKLAELRLPDALHNEFPDYTFEIAQSATQPVWDIIGHGPEGVKDILVQVKVGTADYAGDVIDRMHDSPNVIFAVSNEIREKIITHYPELADQLLNFDLSNFDFVENIEKDLHVLADNLGIDVPDSIGDIIPYISEIVLGIRLLYEVIAVEKQFKNIEIDDRGRIHAIKVLILFSRFGISTVCITALGSAGSFIAPGMGTVGGALSGAAVAAYLGRQLRPQTMAIAKWLVQITDDDLFYFRNKERIDSIGQSFDLMATKVAEPNG